MEYDHKQAMSEIQKQSEQETMNHNLVMDEIRNQQEKMRASGNIDFNQLAGDEMETKFHTMNFIVYEFSPIEKISLYSLSFRSCSKHCRSSRRKFQAIYCQNN